MSQCGDMGYVGYVPDFLFSHFRSEKKTAPVGFAQLTVCISARVKPVSTQVDEPKHEAWRESTDCERFVMIRVALGPIEKNNGVHSSLRVPFFVQSFFTCFFWFCLFSCQKLVVFSQPQPVCKRWAGAPSCQHRSRRRGMDVDP